MRLCDMQTTPNVLLTGFVPSDKKLLLPPLVSAWAVLPAQRIFKKVTTPISISIYYLYLYGVFVT